ncbi:MAG: tRNA pseudouridine(38-40) synthase TruA, partial [Deltaproteobacteria bacterium]|nr:tRNA pseudouridine(38-40) synthase TruA [Deltaproteobacteria bacterium]
TLSSIPVDGFLRGLNSLLPEDLVVVGCAETRPSFHARHSARGKRYRYLLLNQPLRCPQLARRAWHVRGRLDSLAMAEAAALLVGTHDFSCFRASDCTAASPMKQLHRLTLSIQRGCPLVVIEVVGEAFLKYMVRNIVGTLVQVGLRRQPAGWAADVLLSRKRGMAGPTAPPWGLTLQQVYYDAEEVRWA